MMNLPSSCFTILLLVVTTSGHQRRSESNLGDIDENLRKLAIANNDLAVKMHRQLTKDSNDNVFFSPLSLSTAFGMLFYGTRGATAEELRAVLGYDRADLEDSSVHQAFRKYLTEILPSQDASAYTLNSANAVLLARRLDVLSQYKTEVENYYQASVQDVDFATQGHEIVRQINDWVKEKTVGKIDGLLDELDPNTLLVLLNAVYFKGTWKTEFDPEDTYPMNFYNYGLRSNKTRTDMMTIAEEFPFADTDDAKVLELPYKGDNISMVLLLPKEPNTLASLERSLTATKLAELRSQLVKKQVTVTLPKFKLEYSRELSSEFADLGAGKIFDPAADFSGMTSSNEDIAVSEILHKAVIEVNEEGSEAAGVTGIIVTRMIDLSASYFTANRPFLFAIVDKRNDLILFLGRLTNL